MKCVSVLLLLVTYQLDTNIVFVNVSNTPQYLIIPQTSKTQTPDSTRESKNLLVTAN